VKDRTIKINSNQLHLNGRLLKPPFHNSKTHEKINERIITCSYCKRNGHDREKCYNRLKDKKQIRTLNEIESSDTDISDTNDEDELSNQSNLNSDDEEERGHSSRINKSSSHKSNLTPIVKISINEKPSKFLIDTGASISIIKTHLLRKEQITAVQTPRNYRR